LIDAYQALLVVLILGSAILAGRLLAPYVVRVYSRAPGRLDRLLNPVENAIYRVVGADPAHMMGWKEYFLAALYVNLVQMVIAFIILTYQGVLPLNPQHFLGLHWDLAFNTAISIATNTNLQHYNGEYQLSYLGRHRHLCGRGVREGAHQRLQGHG
jgi:potassium-transporting ATPase potassium-binding subunit